MRAESHPSPPMVAPLSPPAPPLVPLTDMSAGDSYWGEEGGLYGDGQNHPPSAHLQAALRAAAMVRPLDADGRPASDGAIGLAAVGFSNTAREFREFLRLAQPARTCARSIRGVNVAQERMGTAEWAAGAATGTGPWTSVADRIAAGGLTPSQVQVAWIKMAHGHPASVGPFPAHVERMTRDLRTTAVELKRRFVNLRLAYFSSRVYAGYTVQPLSPEPYAYESAFGVRRVIREQITGRSTLNADPNAGPVRAPVLLWGPYLWADGRRGRRGDTLVWEPGDFRDDGIHPNGTGSRKVAALLLAFLSTDATARPWFVP